MKTFAELKAELDQLIKASKDGNLTDEQVARIDTIKGDIESARTREKAIAESEKVLAAMATVDETKAREPKDEGPAGSVGEQFVKAAGDRLKGLSEGERFTISGPESKAATDVQVRPAGMAPAYTDVDKNIVTGPRRRLTVEDLLGKETISGAALTYFVEGALEGDADWVAENGEKPQIHFADPTPVTESLSKIAAFIKESDELLEDLPFLKTAIDGRLLYTLNLKVEDTLLNGTGAGAGIKGLLNRSGVQTETSAALEDNADAIFRALNKVQAGSGLDADGIIINPLDYQKLRLSKDANGQYFGGGFFGGQYGQGGIIEQPPLWGVRTVVTPAIAAGTVLVGSFAQAASLVNKGGVRVDMTNSNEDDFIHNRVLLRGERRLLLPVRRPSGFVKLTLSDVAGGGA